MCMGMETPAYVEACMIHALPGRAWQDRGNIQAPWLPPGPFGESRTLFCLGSCFVAQIGLQLMILLPQPLEGWDFKHMISGPGPLKSSTALDSWWSSPLSHWLIHEVLSGFLSSSLGLSLRFLILQWPVQSCVSSIHPRPGD